MSNFIIPATLVRRGYQVIEDRTLKRAFPGTGRNVTGRDFYQYQQNKVISWSYGFTDITLNTIVFGSSRTGV